MASVKAPAECLDEARRYMAERRDPHDVAMADQAKARAHSTLAEVAGPGLYPNQRADYVEGERSVAFLLAASAALRERLREPTARVCEHITFEEPSMLQIPSVIDLGVGVLACEPCWERNANDPELHGPGWASDRCDVCGEPTATFMPVAFPLGPSVAHANICPTCQGFLAEAHA